MRKMFELFAVSCLVMATVTIGACGDKHKPPCLTCPSPVETLAPRVYASAMASANVFIRCENGTTVTVNVAGYGEAFAVSYEEAKKLADQKAEADLETARAKAQANVTVVCGSTPAPAPPVPVPVPPPPTPPVPVPVPPQPTPNCTYAIVPKIKFDYQGGSNGSFFIGTQDGCPWSLESKDFWIVIKTDLSGTSSRKIPLFLAGNGPSIRTGHIDVRGAGGKLLQTIDIEQGARP